MSILLRESAEIIHKFHAWFIKVFKSLGFSLNDKQLHFIIIGLLGLLIFIFINLLFKELAKYSIKAISFIYTITVLIVIVFAIEVQQKVMRSGNMEFADIVYGLWGFLFFLLIYLGILKLGQWIKNKQKR